MKQSRDGLLLVMVPIIIVERVVMHTLPFIRRSSSHGARQVGTGVSLLQRRQHKDTNGHFPSVHLSLTQQRGIDKRRWPCVKGMRKPTTRRRENAAGRPQAWTVDCLTACVRERVVASCS